LSGVAPVTKRSGKSCIVVMRYAAHVRLRNTVYHWARVAIQHDPRSRSRYTALRQRGHSHGRAIRGTPTDSSMSPASCYSDKLRLIPITASRQQPNPTLTLSSWIWRPRLSNRQILLNIIFWRRVCVASVVLN
jgi:hypothetical protein